MRITAKVLAILLALTLLLPGCREAVDFRDGYWAERKDVPFVTAMEAGFYLFKSEEQIACTLEYLDGWSGPEAPNEDILTGDEHAFTAAGYLDVLEPHEGVKTEDIYETAFIFYLVYNEETGQVSAVAGYMDEGIDDIYGVIDADTAAMYIDLFYDSYDSYIAEHGEIG